MDFSDLKTQEDDETHFHISNWLEGNYDLETKQEIRRLLNENPTELADAFYTTLSFGTAGFRGLMGVGTNRVNIYTVGTSIQGLCNYLIKQTDIQTESKKESLTAHQVLIGYDSRCHSREFAERAAKIFAGNGIRALIFKEMRPTPFVSFGCRFKHCSAAVMFTASHNPPQYNGFKIYWDDGAQVLPPHTIGIVNEINAIQDVNQIKSVPDLAHPLIEEVMEEIDEAYFNMISRLQNFRESNQLNGEMLEVVYTSLHGTGITVVPKTLARWGFTSIHLVEKQVVPDCNFSTVPFPNPEEPAALALGVQKLQEINGDLLIATDPDGDRVGVAVLHHGIAKILTGNQVSVLLLEHLCESLTSRNKMPANAAFVKTLTTTELFKVILDYYQKPCFNVLPGFKYVAEKIRIWDGSKARQFIFGAEEACGYLLGSDVRDKDGIGILPLICEMALQAKLKNHTLVDCLNDIYRKYGFYYASTESLIFADTKEGREQMSRSMDSLRSWPLKRIADSDVFVFEDYKRLMKIELNKNQTEPLPFAKSDMVIFWLKDGSKLIVRPSGTEPKIKIYCEVNEKNFSVIQETEERCERRQKKLTSALKQILKGEREELSQQTKAEEVNRVDGVD